MTPGEFSDKTDQKFIARLQNAKVNAEDFDRSQRAAAGLETGDGSNHNHKGSDRRLYAKGRKGGSAISALDLALQDQEYAALYQDVSVLLSNIETATEAALERAQKALDDVTKNAARLPDGRAVFKDKDGNVWTEDGKRVDPKTTAGIVWPDGAPTREEYLERRRALEELRRYQVDVIGKARDRMNDPDDPLSKDELKRIQKMLEETNPAVGRREVAPDTEPEPANVKTASHEIEVFKFD